MYYLKRSLQCTRQTYRTKKFARTQRRGVAVVELAVTAPVLILLAFGIIEYAQLSHAAQVVSNASRRGARFAARHETASTGQVEYYIRDFIAESFANLSSGQAKEAVQVTVVDGSGTAIPNSDLTSLNSGEPLSVNVTFDFESIRVLDHFSMLNQKTLQTTTVARRE